MGLAASMALAALPAVAASGWSEQGPLIAGTRSYVDGSLIWADYVLDDRGANTDATLAAGGDDAYPAGLENMADLVQLQLEVVPEGLHVRAILNGLVDASCAERNRLRIPGSPQPVSNGFVALLSENDAVRLDLLRMGLSTHEELAVEISGDGASTLHLAGNWLGPFEVERGGAENGRGLR